MINVVFLGEAMREMAANGRLHFGGDTLNTAVYLARVTSRDSLQIHYATAIGLDPDSEQLLALMASEGLTTNLVDT